MIDWYVTEAGRFTKCGRSTAADHARIRAYATAEKRADRLAAASYISHVEWRHGEGAGPATAANDLIWMRQVLKSARPALGVAVDLQALDDAAHALRSRKLIAKSKRRERRMTSDDERRLLE